VGISSRQRQAAKYVGIGTCADWHVLTCTCLGGNWAILLSTSALKLEEFGRDFFTHMFVGIAFPIVSIANGTVSLWSFSL
jgi:hypothetical protein